MKYTVFLNGGISLELPKAINQILGVSPTDIQNANQYRLLNPVEEHHTFTKSSRYPTLNKVRTDLLSFFHPTATLHEKITIIVINAPVIDLGSEYFIKSIMSAFDNIEVKLESNKNIQTNYINYVQSDYEKSMQSVNKNLISSSDEEIMALLKYTKYQNVIGNNFSVLSITDEIIQSKSITDVDHLRTAYKLKMFSSYNFEQYGSVHECYEWLEEYGLPLDQVLSHYIYAMMLIRRDYSQPLTNSVDKAQQHINIAYEKLIKHQSIDENKQDYYSLLAVNRNGQALIDLKKGDLKKSEEAMNKSREAVEAIKDIDLSLYNALLPVAISNMARLKFFKKENQEAIIMQQSVIHMEPYYLDNYYHLAKFLLNDAHQCIDVLNKIIKDYPCDPDFYSLRAIAFEKINLQSAEEDHRLAWKYSSNRSFAHIYNYASSLCLSGQYHAAQKILNTSSLSFNRLTENEIVQLITLQAEVGLNLFGKQTAIRIFEKSNLTANLQIQKNLELLKGTLKNDPDVLADGSSVSIS